MPWRRSHYLIALKKLDPRIRDKAIEIADALLQAGFEEGKAIPLAIAQAKQWANESYKGSQQTTTHHNMKTIWY